MRNNALIHFLYLCLVRAKKLLSRLCGAWRRLLEVLERFSMLKVILAFLVFPVSIFTNFLKYFLSMYLRVRIEFSY